MRRSPSKASSTTRARKGVAMRAGRLLEAAFAQSPASGFAPASGGAYYDNAQPASRRARAHYEYDPAGRATLVAHGWDAWGGSAYASQALLANACDYEAGTGLNRGLKTASRFYSGSASAPATFALDRTETYGYDAQLDYLTSASYGDGNPNATPTWSYDAAGNRNDAVCDALNRATSLGGVAVTSDILGNRSVNGMRRTGVVYGWDCLSRMTSYSDHTASPQREAYYGYRADGMRVWKAVDPTRDGSGNVVPTALYRHDGQMGIEDVETTPTATAVTRYGLGARGVDMIERTSGSTVTLEFPLYDAQGNMVATLSRNGTGYSVNDRRSYDAWGVVRAQQSGGDPELRYCASLGHRQDDESGLVYMRARYYEPTSGRFISEDPGMYGTNWFAYCGNNPVSFSDRTGKMEDWSQACLAVGYGFELLSWALIALSNYVTSKADVGALVKAAMGAAGFAVFAFSLALCAPGVSVAEGVGAASFGAFMLGVGPWVEGCLAAAVGGAKASSNTLAKNAVMFTFLYSLEVMGALVAIDYDSEQN